MHRPARRVTVRSAAGRPRCLALGRGLGSAGHGLGLHRLSDQPRDPHRIAAAGHGGAEARGLPGPVPPASPRSDGPFRHDSCVSPGHAVARRPSSGSAAGSTSSTRPISCCRPAGAPPARRGVSGSPFTAPLRREGDAGSRSRGTEGGANLVADLEGLGANCRTQPGHKLTRRHAHPPDSCFQHPCRQAAPAGMGSRHDGSGPIAEKDGQAIGGHHRTDPTRLSGKGGIGLDRIDRQTGIDHANTMHLPQPERLGRQRIPQTRAVGSDTPRIVTDMVAQIEAVPGRRTATAGPQGLYGPDIGRCRPVGNQQISHSAGCRADCACPPATGLPTAS